MREVEFYIRPEDYVDPQAIHSHVAKAANIPIQKLTDFRILRRSLDARKHPPRYLVRAIVADQEKLPVDALELDHLPDVSGSATVYIIGAGPAGYFAALECIRLNLKPIVLDRERMCRRDEKIYGRFNKMG